MTYFKIVIETLLPKSQRTGPDVDDAIAGQFPVSEWLPVDEWYRIITRLRANGPPVHLRGLMYGHQTKQDDKALDVSNTIAEMHALKPDEFMLYFERRVLEQERAYNEVERRVNEFLNAFPTDLYAGIYGADLMGVKL